MKMACQNPKDEKICRLLRKGNLGRGASRADLLCSIEGPLSGGGDLITTCGLYWEKKIERPTRPQPVTLQIECLQTVCKAEWKLKLMVSPLIWLVLDEHRR